MRPSWFCIAAAIFVWPATSDAKLILITRGDYFSHLGEMNPKNRTAELPPAVNSVGFKYWAFGVFWIDVWRCDGEYCLYEGKNYYPISRQKAAMLLGVPESEIAEPFFYRFPPGLIVLGILAIFGIGSVIARQIQKDKVMTLVRDPRYQQALDIFREQVAKANAPAQSILSEEQATPAPSEPPPNPTEPWEAAIAHLVASGIEKPEAEENFGKVLGYAMQRANDQAVVDGAS